MRKEEGRADRIDILHGMRDRFIDLSSPRERICTSGLPRFIVGFAIETMHFTYLCRAERNAKSASRRWEVLKHDPCQPCNGASA